MTTIAIAGSIAQRPGRPGHAWALLAYALGFRELGHEVLFLDRLHRRGDASWLTGAMAVGGLQGRYAALLDGGGTIGLSRRQIVRELGRAELLLNVNGF